MQSEWYSSWKFLISNLKSFYHVQYHVRSKLLNLVYHSIEQRFTEICQCQLPWPCATGEMNVPLTAPFYDEHKKRDCKNPQQIAPVPISLILDQKQKRWAIKSKWLFDFTLLWKQHERINRLHFVCRFERPVKWFINFDGISVKAHSYTIHILWTCEEPSPLRSSGILKCLDFHSRPNRWDKRWVMIFPWLLL